MHFVEGVEVGPADGPCEDALASGVVVQEEDLAFGGRRRWPRFAPAAPMRGFGNTTVGLVATNADLDKVGCHLVAQSAHDGLARAVFPAHPRADGDAAFSIASTRPNASSPAP